MRNYFLAGNWKMNKTPSEAKSFAAELKASLKGASHKLMVAPSFIAIPGVAEELKGSNILVGAQNMSNAESGAHTGEVSPEMLKDAGVDVVILGHSERRAIYGESDAFINEKVQLALNHGFEVILCVGETLDEREGGKLEEIVRTQTVEGLKNVSESSLSKVTIAYEPVWAIGTGKTATPQDADDVHAFIRKVLAETYSSDAAEAMVIQYGGSVKPGNVKELMAKENIDGALVGGASLKVEDFTAIAKFDT
ncbi:triose-phosphate isomerase [Salinispira pacifica]|uniref:Triosephosphate isomerase n=1 Tax=Salinispira pacifica TaxID=1307761 RepID=V5WJ97_9SPIO|nr:triose-phosphate isomerase [Salinispira pacifica]AHC15241.1 Triosephosphate isomerase [Salinispira pacifica]